MAEAEFQDIEWADDWKIIVDIFDTIDTLKLLLSQLDISYYHQIEQKIIILNLEKYAFSLQNYIIEKYSEK